MRKPHVLFEPGVNDEPEDGGNSCLTIQLTIDSTLEPKWEVVCNRKEARPISHSDRKLLSVANVGNNCAKDMVWGKYSVLQKYADAKGVLHDAHTAALREIASHADLHTLDDVGETLISVGQQYGVGFESQIKNKMFIQNGTFSSSVGLFEGNTPLNQKGTGSQRLLSMGLNIQASSGNALLLIDEVESGLEPAWAGSVLKATYAGVVVDEYQDCIQAQHEIILEMSRHLPIRVLGDPMQGIFSFAGSLVDWNKLEFPVVNVATQPWRWSKSNPELGRYLMTVRESLLPALTKQCCKVQIDPENKNVEVVSPANFTGYSHLKELSQFSSVVYIVQWPKQQLDFCARMPGIFQYDEKQDCDELFNYAKLFDSKNKSELALAVIMFAAECSTGIGKELKSYIDKLKICCYDKGNEKDIYYIRFKYFYIWVIM